VKTLRNVCIVLGLLYCTAWLEVVFAWPIQKLTRGIIYDEGLLWALAMGFIVSLPRTCTAIVAGTLLPLLVQSRRSIVWGIVLALMLLSLGPRHIHSVRPLQRFDYEYLAAQFIFPSLACVAATIVSARRAGRQVAPDLPQLTATEHS
jgi:hypothetical protein